MDKEFDLDPDDLSNATINYQKIINDRTMMCVTRALAMDMTLNPYMTVGTFLRDIADHDLQGLVDLVNDQDEEDEPKNPRVAELLLMAEILARAEGVETKDIDDVVRHMNMFTTLIVCESLYRKGLCDVFHENMSFGMDAAEMLVAKAKK